MALPYDKSQVCQNVVSVVSDRVCPSVCVLNKHVRLLSSIWAISPNLEASCHRMILKNKFIYLLVTSRLDYSDSVLSGCSKRSLKSLQLVQMVW